MQDADERWRWAASSPSRPSWAPVVALRWQAWRIERMVT